MHQMDEIFIFHVDVNSAFLSWSALEQLKKDPASVDLRTVPSAVGGDRKTRHGIITAKSIPAKKYGVETGEPVVKALSKCPNLILVPSDREAYKRYSKAFIGILRDFSDCVQQVSVDEAYMDMTEAVRRQAERQAMNDMDKTGKDGNGWSADRGTQVVRERSADPAGQFADPDNRHLRKAACELADRIRERVRDELHFTVNVGIAHNKLLAKTASDFSKPDRTHTLWPEEISGKFWTLPIGELHGCGQATAQRLTGIGLKTIGDTARMDPSILRGILGEKSGNYIYESCNGWGSNHVKAQRDEVKGYSNETTTPYDIVADNFDEAALPLLHHLADKVAARMEKDHVYANTIGVTIKTNTFARRSRQTTLSASTNSAPKLRDVAEGLLRELLFGEKGIFAQGLGVRLIGVSATHLDDGSCRQMSLEDFLTKPTEISEKAIVSGSEHEIDAVIEAVAEDEAGIQRKAVLNGETGALIHNVLEACAKKDAQPEKAMAGNARARRLEDMMKSIRGRYGEASVSQGWSSISEAADPEENT